jgi:hypothetical protein
VTAVPLLNPQLDLEGARQVIAVARTRLVRIEERLHGTCLDREEYLKAFGAAATLREVLSEMEHQYRMIVNQ